ncbi:hypothetical protein LUZ60_007939 [Juncus effusus]|nr:hypothetical protein LUZ60_007939 [Juncus effusus]
MAPCCSLSATFTVVGLVLFVLAVPAKAAAPAAKNHTVGGTAGWFYNSSSEFPATNYSAWVASEKSFSLGDFLIFNTNTNSTVVQTNNATTFEQCYASTDEGNATFVYGGNVGGSNSSAAKMESIAVPLSFAGINFFFSDTEDGQQCLNGMRFVVNVSRGSGSPETLSPPPAGLPPPASPETGSSKQNDNGGAGVVRGGMVWACFGVLSLVLMVV